MNANQIACDKIGGWNIPNWMMDIINDTDINIIDDVYGGFESEDDLMDYMEREYGYWYAIMMDDDDNDWGFGEYDRDEAVNLAKSINASYIAVIKMGDDPICVDEIRDLR